MTKRTNTNVFLIILAFLFISILFYMGGIVAKLNSSNHILSAKFDSMDKKKKISNEELSKIIDYFNKYGVLKFKFNTINLDLVLNNYLKNLNDFKLTIKNNTLLGSSIGIMSISNFGLAMIVDNKKVNSKEELEFIIPKILLSREKEEFINYISKIFSTDNNSKIIYNIMKYILEKITSESNPDVKIANLTNLIIRIMIINSILSEFKNLNSKNFSQDDQSNFILKVLFELLTIIPTDRCLFNENNVLDLDPNICNNIQTKSQESTYKNILIIILAILVIIFAVLFFGKKCKKLVRLSKLDDDD